MGAFIPVLIGEPADRPDEADTAETAHAILAALGRLGHSPRLVTLGLDLGLLEALAAERPRVVVNLVEAIRGDGRLAWLACPVLDHLGLAYTGSGTAAYHATTSKLEAKRVLAGAGLPTPRWWTQDAPPPDGVRVIVKPVMEHGSLGIDSESVIEGAEAVRRLMARRARTFGGAFFAEAFCAGREFNIALLEAPSGPRVLPIPEMRFGGYAPGRPQIMDYAAKWEPGDPAYQGSGGRFGLEASDPALAARLGELAREVWSAFGLAGYARVDLRLDETGEPMVIDVNANPCLAPDAGFFRAVHQSGLGYDAMIAAILDAALVRAQGGAI